MSLHHGQKKYQNPVISYSTAEDGRLLLRTLKLRDNKSQLQGRAYFTTTPKRESCPGPREPLLQRWFPVRAKN